MSENKPTIKSWAQLDAEDSDAHHKPYFDWLRHVVTISLATLTALVSLQGQYIPRNPHLIWTIQVAWGALVLCILFGLFSLRWEFEKHLAIGKKRGDLRQQVGDRRAQEALRAGLYVPAPRSHKWAASLMLTCLAVALTMLCVFGSANFGRELAGSSTIHTSQKSQTDTAPSEQGAASATRSPA